MSNLYFIEHIPTKRKYTPNTAGAFRTGRNWRKNQAVLFTNVNDAINETLSLIDNHRSGAEPLRIRSFGGYDAPRWQDSVGDGFIRDRDFRVVEFNGTL